MTASNELVFKKKVDLTVDQIHIEGYTNASMCEQVEIEYRLQLSASNHSLRGSLVYVPTSQLIECVVFAEDADGEVRQLNAQLQLSDVAIELDRKDDPDSLPGIEATDLNLGEVICEVIQLDEARSRLRLKSTATLVVCVS